MREMKLYSEDRNLLKRMEEYVIRFNQNDEETICQEIPNEHALEWMKENVPYVELPEPVLEEIYYFRWWTYRKHIKRTEKGYIITEFLPSVRWAGPYNSINCALGFHIREGRWLVQGDRYLKDYILFWLNNEGDTRSYSCWLAYAVWEYCMVRGDYSLGVEQLDKLCANYEIWEREKKHLKGLFWSHDDRDAMEFSISGPGFRPTLNSYMYADAYAIAMFAKMAGKEELAEKYHEKAKELKQKIQEYLWDKDFFKVIPEKDISNLKMGGGFPKIAREHNVREAIGYIPWYFNLPDAGYEKAFLQLLDEEGFKARYGITTAEKRHERYRYFVDHECLWNGPVWPYATTQTLVALANLLRNYKQSYIGKEDYYKLLKQYAESQHLIKEEGNVVPWIDEDQDPETGEWIAREELKKRGWRPEEGGYERGKDYNHSMYCDLILSGLLGIEDDGKGNPKITPLIPEAWEYFRIENLSYGGKKYIIFYDKTGKKYGEGKGIHIQKV